LADGFDFCFRESHNLYWKKGGTAPDFYFR
jgi:hypothetical protein